MKMGFANHLTNKVLEILCRNARKEYWLRSIAGLLVECGCHDLFKTTAVGKVSCRGFKVAGY
jgi:hypothetical protein